MKQEWKKVEKQFYLPKTQPEYIHVPTFKFFTLEGKGNPNDAFFEEYIGVLYALSYGVKMSSKRGLKPLGYFDYTVYPLEGIWDFSDEAKVNDTSSFNKNDLVFKLMIRQPDFVDTSFAQIILDETKKKKPLELLDQVRFEEIADGDCIQMLHIGPYDNEEASFSIMEDFAAEHHFRRTSQTHREIYLSDARRVSPDKLKTVLRFMVEKVKEE